MSVIARLFIVVGLLITIAGNFFTYYELRTAVNGMQVAAAEGIGVVVSGTHSAYFYSVVSLFGRPTE